MAINFNNINANQSQINPGGTGTNFSGDIFLDASIFETLKEMGYNFHSTDLDFDYAYQNFDKIYKTIFDDKSIPALKDSQGRIFIVDENRTVYYLTKINVEPPINPPQTGGETPPPGYKPETGGPLYPPSPGGILGSGKIYSRFDTSDIIPNQQEIVTRALWTNNIGNLLTYYTSSNQNPEQKRYYYEIFNSSSLDDCASEAQFSLAYGNIYGSGSNDHGAQIEDTPTRAIYGQYRLLCLDGNQSKFIIGGKATEHIYVINVNRARMREFIDEGSIEVNLAKLNGEEYINGGGTPDTYTGSAVQVSGSNESIRLIDDSKINPAMIMQSGEVHNIVSGNLEDGVYNPESPHIYGLLFKRQGIIILDADKLDESGSFATVVEREVDGDNAFKLFTAISGAALFTDGSGDHLGFKGRGAERVKSAHYFVRVKNGDYNFSNNPSFVTGSRGDLANPSMAGDPKTYITTIGLYNERKDLIAVAKMSQAIQKSFTKEALIKVKLDF